MLLLSLYFLFFFFPFFTKRHVQSCSLLSCIRITSIEALKSCFEFLGFRSVAVVVSTLEDEANTLFRNVGHHPVMRHYVPGEQRPTLTLFIIGLLRLKFDSIDFTVQSNRQANAKNPFCLDMTLRHCTSGTGHFEKTACCHLQRSKV